MDGVTSALVLHGKDFILYYRESVKIFFLSFSLRTSPGPNTNASRDFEFLGTNILGEVFLPD
jgi:hypothetical protein